MTPGLEPTKRPFEAYRLTHEYVCAESARLVLPGISEVGWYSLLLAERFSFSLISCSTSISYLSFFITNLYRFFNGDHFFFSDDTQIRTTEEQAYKRTAYLLDHNVTLISLLFLQI